MKGMWFESFIFIGIVLVIIGIPCAAIAILGYRMIERLGRYPSKTPAIQMSIFWKLIVIEIVSLTVWLAFFRFFES